MGEVGAGAKKRKRARRAPRTVEEAIRAAEAILPGRMARGDRPDPRWQAMFVIKEFLETDPEPIWEFCARWGRHRSQDLRSGVGCVLLEHLLPLHFESVFPRARDLARKDERFVFTLGMCEPSFCAPRERRRLELLMDELQPWRVSVRKILARQRRTSA